MPRNNGPLPIFFGRIALILLSLSVAYGLYYSMDWPLMHDGAVMHYIAWRILEGAAPYRDVFDMNMPGAYLLNMLCIRIFGPGDFAFRLFDLFFCLLAAAAICTLSRRGSKLYAYAAALLYTAFHLSWGAPSMGERDFLMVPFVLFAAYELSLFLERPGKKNNLLAFGLLTGTALCIKPVAALFIALSAVAIALQPLPWPQKCKAFATIALGALIPLALMHLWLYRLGVIGDFYDTAFHFTYQFYSRLQPFSLHYILLFALFASYSFFALMFLMYKRSTLPAAHKTILTISLLYGYLHFFLQGKGYWYHTYPLAAFMCLYFSLVLPRLHCRLWEALTVYAVALIVCIYFSPLQALSRENLDHYRTTFSLAKFDTTAQDVDAALKSVPSTIAKPYLAHYPNRAIQFFSINSDLWNTAYRYHWIAPSRHILLYPLYGLYHSDYMQSLADELFHDLSTTKPLVIIVSAKSWPYNEPLAYRAIDHAQPWQAFFAAHYRLVKETDDYRIYARSK